MERSSSSLEFDFVSIHQRKHIDYQDQYCSFLLFSFHLRDKTPSRLQVLCCQLQRSQYKFALLIGVLDPRRAHVRST